MAGESRPSPPTEAVLLDALGTLVTFADPAPALRRELRERAGLEVDAATAKAAVRAEIAFYRANLGQARDAASLARLRAACGDVVRRAVGAPEAPLEPVTEALLAAIAFVPFPEVPGALAALRARGLALAVVSNWDVSLHEVLERCGLTGFAAVVTSAEEGTAKPEPDLFLRALDRLGVAPGAALHAGDSVEEDLAGARAAGVRAVLVDRDGTAPAGVPAVPSLRELVALAA
jgi:putative hydrolase of the HAD superfamily